MKSSKRVLSLMTTIFIVSSLNIFGGQTFEEHWSYSFVKQLIDNKLLSRTLNDTKELNEYMTRDELYELLRVNKIITDINAVSVRDVMNASASGDSFLTREEACIILGDLINKDFVTELNFPDAGRLSEAGRKALMKLNYFYIIDGYPDGYFIPQDFITKAEALKLIALLRKIPAEYLTAAVNKSIGNRSLQSSYNPVNTPDVFNRVIDTESSNTESSPTTTAEQIIPANPNITEALTPARQTPQVTQQITKNTPEPVMTLFNKPPSITVSAKQGSKFRSIDALITAYDDKSYPVLYYLALETGSAMPSSIEIIDYAKGKKTAGLTDGTVVRGKILAYFEDYNKELTLYGGDDVKKIKGETGFIDGYKYDFYLVGVDSEGKISNIASCKNIMAMPFDSADYKTNTFTVRNLNAKLIKEKYPDLQADNKNNKEKINRTARQLENIQRLADLYVETNGKHGDISYLTNANNTYVLDDDLDLSAYMAAGNETGWTPIGNADADERFFFGGSFEGKFHTISNLYIDRNIDVYGKNIGYQGLFGKIYGATVRNVTLDNSKIIIEGVGVGNESYIGSLVGYAKNSVVDNITIDTPNMKAYSLSDRTINSVGGLAGFADNTDIDSISINNAEITTKKEESKKLSYSDYTGGLVGRFRDLGEANLLSNINVSGIINATGFAAGGVAGEINCVADNGNSIYVYNIDSTVRINGEALNSGGIVGKVENATEQSLITFDNCYASGAVSGAGNVGGIFGEVKALKKSSFILKNSASNADVYSESINAVIGGVVATTSGGSYEYCEAVGSTVRSGLQRIGGFVGYVTGDTDFIGCMSNKSVDANRIAGGFVGEANGNVNFYRCSSQGAIVNAHGRDIGGFMGLQSGGNILLSGCFATNTVIGGENSGGFVGRVGAETAGGFIRCYSSGDTTGTVNTGGFIGRMENESLIQDSFSTGKVEVDGKQGSFIGNRQSNIKEAS